MRSPLLRRAAPAAGQDVAPRAVSCADDGEDTPISAPQFGAFLRYFLGLGTWGFGGPIATVGYMQRDLVERRRWLAES